MISATEAKAATVGRSTYVKAATDRQLTELSNMIRQQCNLGFKTLTRYFVVDHDVMDSIESNLLGLGYKVSSDLEIEPPEGKYIKIISWE